jgi:hypothetical protein
LVHIRDEIGVPIVLGTRPESGKSRKPFYRK